VSGNVSLYNATDGRNIPPTPALGVVGVNAEKRVFPSVASKTGDHVYRVCHSGESTLGGSLFARIYKEVLQLSDFSWERERALLSFIKDLQEVGAVQSCRAVGSGGLLGTMPSFLINSESFGLGSIVGLHWDAEFEQDLRHLSPLERAELLFGEQNGGFLIASAWAPPRFRDVFLHHPGGLRYEYLGRLATEPMMKWSVGAQPLMDWQKNFLRGCQR
jgi:phosphoribosylformylglycinamidine (FGAM) synthase-like enzyme